MTTALIGAVIGALLAAAAAVVLSRRARAAAAESEARAAAAAARAGLAEQRLAELRDVVPLVALRLDGAGRLAEANRLALERFPFLQPGMSVLEAFSEHRWPARSRRPSADLARRELRGAPVRRTGGTPTGPVEPYRSATGGRRWCFLTRRLEAVDYQELRSQFVSNVSHELRTPLTGLRALLEALDDPRWTRRRATTSPRGPPARRSASRR